MVHAYVSFDEAKEAATLLVGAIVDCMQTNPSAVVPLLHQLKTIEVGMRIAHAESMGTLPSLTGPPWPAHRDDQAPAYASVPVLSRMSAVAFEYVVLRPEASTAIFGLVHALRELHRYERAWEVAVALAAIYAELETMGTYFPIEPSPALTEQECIHWLMLCCAMVGDERRDRCSGEGA